MCAHTRGRVVKSQTYKHKKHNKVSVKEVKSRQVDELMRWHGALKEKKKQQKNVAVDTGDKSATRQLCVSVPLVCVSLCFCQSPLKSDGLQGEGERANTEKVTLDFFVLVPFRWLFSSSQIIVFQKTWLLGFFMSLHWITFYWTFDIIFIIQRYPSFLFQWAVYTFSYQCKLCQVGHCPPPPQNKNRRLLIYYIMDIICLVTYFIKQAFLSPNSLASKVQFCLENIELTYFMNVKLFYETDTDCLKCYLLVS